MSESNLMQFTVEEKKMILKEHGVTEEEFEDSVNILKNWIIKNENILGWDPSAYVHQLRVTLINCKMSLEACKKAFEGYMTAKTLYACFFDQMIPGEHLDKIGRISKNVVMPKLLPDLCRVQISKSADILGEAGDGMSYFLMGTIIAQLRFFKDFYLSTELLLDLENFGVKNLLKFTPTVNYTILHSVSLFKNRFHRIHIVNTPSIFDKVLYVMKTFLPAKIMGKIKVHKTMEELHEFIPKEYLPSDYGGTERSLEEIHEAWMEEIRANEPLLKAITKMKLKEVKIRPKEVMDELGMGFDGTFKRLTVD